MTIRLPGIGALGFLKTAEEKDFSSDDVAESVTNRRRKLIDRNGRDHVSMTTCHAASGTNVAVGGINVLLREMTRSEFQQRICRCRRTEDKFVLVTKPMKPMTGALAV